MGTKIDLPNTLTAEVDVQYVDENRWRGDYRYFIVLYFGNVEISRWEWQADKLPEERSEPDEHDVADLVASKLRALLTEKGMRDEDQEGEAARTDHRRAGTAQDDA